MSTENKKKTLRRELIEWTIMISVIAILFVTGLHVTVFGFIQRGLVETGLIQPSVKTENILVASYDFRLTDSNGNTKDFSDFKGKTIFLNFWATWCPPCIAEMPNIHDLYKEVGDQVVFVMVSQDEVPEKASQFIDRRGYEFPVYFLETSLPRVFDHQSIPTTFVIDPKGNIVVAHSGFAKYSTQDFKDFLLGL